MVEYNYQNNCEQPKKDYTLIFQIVAVLYIHTYDLLRLLEVTMTTMLYMNVIMAFNFPMKLLERNRFVNQMVTGAYKKASV